MRVRPEIQSISPVSAAGGGMGARGAVAATAAMRATEDDGVEWTAEAVDGPATALGGDAARSLGGVLGAVDTPRTFRRRLRGLSGLSGP